MKKIIQLISLFFITSLAACSGSSLIGSENTGLLEIQFLHQDQYAQSIVPDVEGFKKFSNDQGYQITLKEAVVNWNQLNLFVQGEQVCASAPTTSIMIDRSEDFLAGDLQTLLLADGDIPFEEYCKYQLIVAPLGYPSTVKLHEGHGEANAGVEVSFHLAGSWQKGNASGDFEILSTDPVVIEDFFRAEENGNLIMHPLHFHDGETEVGLLFLSSYDLFFNQIDFAVDDAAAQVLQVKKNLALSVMQSYSGHVEE